MKDKMTLQEYVENYDEAPLDLETFASAALKVSDDEELVKLARAFLYAEEQFDQALYERGISVG